jgi:hypothetical protein
MPDYDMAVAEDSGQTYSAAYGSVYPDDGETWFCLVPRHAPIARRNIEVCPLVKAGSVTGREDILEFEDLLRSTYPGVPEALLTVN